ncbi:MAG: hypothetical protein Q7K40_01185, partial [bacterium]|nr:hypothetical protein [bacterium]
MKNSQKGFIVPVLLALIATLLVGGGTYIYIHNKTANQLEDASFAAQTVGWKTYSNTTSGVTFKYPPNWLIRETTDKSGVDFAKSELAPNDPGSLKKIFLTLYISDLILGKEGSGYKATPQDYFNEYYGVTRASTSSKWMTLEGNPVYYQQDVETDQRVLTSDYSFLLFTNDKILIFKVKPGVLLNNITGPWQPTTYEPQDAELIKQVIGTLSLSDKSVKLVNAGDESPIGALQTTDWKTYINTQYGYQINYPKNTSVSAVENVVYPGLDVAIKDKSGFQMTVSTRSSDKTLQQYLATYDSRSMSADRAIEMTIGVSAALQRREYSIGKGCTGLATYVMKENIIFSFRIEARDKNCTSFNIEDTNLYDQILSSFKFIPATMSSNSQTADWKTYTSTTKGYSISYPADAKIDTSNLSCVRIDTGEFGSVYINAGSQNPCGEPTGIGLGNTKISENVTIGGKQYPASGFRADDNSNSFLSFSLSGKIMITYGVSHSGTLTNTEYQTAIDSAKKIVSTMKLLTTNTSTSVPGMSQYTDTDFGFSFWYPSGWTVKQIPTGSTFISYPGGTVSKAFSISPPDTSREGPIVVKEFSSPTMSITDPVLGCPMGNCTDTVRYYFDTLAHTWMLERPDGIHSLDGTRTTVPVAPANV